MKSRHLALFLLTFIFIFSYKTLLANDGSNVNINLKINNENPSSTSCFNLDGLPPVGDQVVAGSCYAWAAAYYYLTYLQWQEYGWDVTDPAHQCSPAFIYNLTNGGVDNGAWEGDNARRDAFRVFETMGCATMADMPYSYTAFRTFPSEEAFCNGMQFRTLSTHYINTRSDSGIQALKNHLLEGNIAVLGIYGYSNLNNIHQYKNTYCISQTAGSRLYWHDVTVVGFDDHRFNADGVGAFRIVNSWGINWGDDGFFWMSYEAVKNPKTSYGYAMYATDRIDYEPKLVARIEVQHSDRYDLIYKASFDSIESPDTLLTFFNFNPMSLAVGIPYPQSAIALDLTDMIELLNKDNTNNIFLSIHDNRANNNHSGTIESFMIEECAIELSAASFDTPVIITDSDTDAVAMITLDYRFSPPQTIHANLDTLNGQVQLTWDAPTNVNYFIDYGIYQDGILIDSTTSTFYTAELPIPGNHRYGVSSRFESGESLQAMTTLYRPVPFGIPFFDGFETSLIGWIQAGISGIKAAIKNNPVFEGNYSLSMKTNESDYTAIVRLFAPVNGVTYETWFNMEGYPMEGGFGAGAWLTNQQGELIGVSVNNNGNITCIYPISFQDHNVEVLDSTVTVTLNEWYKHKIWYCEGKFHNMLLDKNWNVLLNQITNIPDIHIDRAGLITWGVNNGWNYFDNYSISEWNSPSFEHFTPVQSTDQPYALVITEALIEGDTLKIGDEIAVFDGDLCVGAITVKGDWPLAFNAWQSDEDSPGFNPGNTIMFRIWDEQNNTEYHADITFEVGDGTFAHGIFSRFSLISSQVVSVQDSKSAIPEEFSISRAYPNPFNPKTILILQLPETSEVIITVYNIVGQKVMILVNDRFDAGRHRIVFDAKNLSNGIYFIHTSVQGKMNEIKKVLLLK